MEEHILVVDDEREIADLIEVYLKNEGFCVTKCYNATDALKETENGVDLALLDVMLPDLSGFDLCRKIRDKYTFPIIMLTAKVDDMDKITGLTLGADDYITKPFNPLEVVARVKTQLRRYKKYNSESRENADEISTGALTMNCSSRVCTLNEHELVLTHTEFDILWFLLEHKGEAITSEKLFETVWKEKYFDSNNTVMTHIARIREKMHEQAKNPKYIKTVWGVGYKIE